MDQAAHARRRLWFPPFHSCRLAWDRMIGSEPPAPSPLRTFLRGANYGNLQKSKGWTARVAVRRSADRCPSGRGALFPSTAQAPVRCPRAARGDGTEAASFGFFNLLTQAE